MPAARAPALLNAARHRLGDKHLQRGGAQVQRALRPPVCRVAAAVHGCHLARQRLPQRTKCKRCRQVRQQAQALAVVVQQLALAGRGRWRAELTAHEGVPDGDGDSVAEGNARKAHDGQARQRHALVRRARVRRRQVGCCPRGRGATATHRLLPRHTAAACKQRISAQAHVVK